MEKTCVVGVCVIVKWVHAKSTYQKHPKTHVTSELSCRPLRSVAAGHLLTHLGLVDDKDH